MLLTNILLKGISMRLSVRFWILLMVPLYIIENLPAAEQKTKENELQREKFLNLSESLSNLRLGMDAWVQKKKWEGPPFLVLELDPSKYYAKEYLRFYQGISYFLHGMTAKIPVFEQVRYLNAAKKNLEHINLTVKELGSDYLFWYDEVCSNLLKLTYENKSFFQTLRNAVNLRKKLSEEQLLMVGDSLRATQQLTKLRSLLAAEERIFLNNMEHPILIRNKNIWKKLFAEIQKIDIQSVKAGKKNQANRSTTRNRNLSLNKQLEALLIQIKIAFYGDHNSIFQSLLQGFGKILKKGERKHQTLTKDEKVFLQDFKKSKKYFPPLLLKKYVYKMWKWGFWDEAYKGTEIFVKLYEGHPDVPMIAYDQARILEDSRDYKKAFKVLQSRKNIILGTSHEENMWFRLAWLAYLQKDQQAELLFSQYAERYPDGVYWSTSKYYHFKIRSEKKGSLQDKSILRQEIEAFVQDKPLNFYSLQLIEEWGLASSLLTSGLGSEVQQAQRKDYFFPMNHADMEKFDLYKELQSLGLREAAFFWLNKLSQGMAKYPTWMRYSLQEARKYDNATFATIKSLQSIVNFPSIRGFVQWQDLYPRFEEKNIKKILADYKSPLSYNFIVSLIRQESAFDAKAVSSANARGLMQLIPSTARNIANEIKVKDYDLFRPRENLNLGIYLLTTLYKKYSGRVDYMLSAYNAGEAVTNRWISARGHLDEAEFIESIPYNETRKYIKLIKRNMKFYRLIYARKS